MLYLAKGGFWLSFGQVISAGLSFFLSLAFANLLPASVYGTYKFILSTAGLLNIATLKGATTAITKSVAQKFDGALKQLTQIRLKWSLLSSFLGLTISFWYLYNGNTTLGYSFILISLLSPITDVLNGVGAFFQGKKAFGIMTRQFLTSHTINVLSLLVTIFFTDNIFYILLSYFLPQIIYKFFNYQATLKKYPENDRTDPNILSYTKKLSAINTIPLLASQIDKVLIFHYLGAAPVAIYSFATVLPEQIFGFFHHLNILALPKYSSQNISELRKAVVKKNLMLLPILIIITVAYYFISPYVYKVFFPQYTESIFLSQIYILSITGVLSFLPTTAITSQEKAGSLAKVRTGSSLTQLFLTFILITKFGIIGAVISRVIAKLINVLLGHYLLFKTN